MRKERLPIKLVVQRAHQRNNAGIGYFGRLQEISPTEISQMIDTNVKGTIYVTKAILPTFLERNARKIMNIISTAGLRGKVLETAYCTSKFAVRGFTESLVKELEPTSISVSGVYMGAWIHLFGMTITL